MATISLGLKIEMTISGLNMIHSNDLLLMMHFVNTKNDMWIFADSSQVITWKAPSNEYVQVAIKLLHVLENRDLKYKKNTIWKSECRMLWLEIQNIKEIEENMNVECRTSWRFNTYRKKKDKKLNVECRISSQRHTTVLITFDLPVITWGRPAHYLLEGDFQVITWGRKSECRISNLNASSRFIKNKENRRTKSENLNVECLGSRFKI